jgi:hypothetical protein
MTDPNSALRVSIVGCALACLMRLAYADPPSTGDRPNGSPSGPPPEAITACTGKAAGTLVQFAMRDGHQVSGKCELLDGVLAARPVGGPQKTDGQ